MNPVYKCVRCRVKLSAPSPDHLCDDCRELMPRREGLIDLTSIHRRVVKPKPFVGDDGNILTGELPMRPLWNKPEPNQWAMDGMDEFSLRRNNYLSKLKRLSNG